MTTKKAVTPKTPPAPKNDLLLATVTLPSALIVKGLPTSVAIENATKIVRGLDEST